MVQGWFRSAAKQAAIVSTGVFLGVSFLFASAVWASNPPCPGWQQVLRGEVQLRAIKDHLRQRQPIHILAIGSSSTQGIGASSISLSYPAQLEQFLETRWKYDLITVENAGIGGETASETVRRLEDELKEKPDLVIWQIGTNDAVRGLDLDRFRAMVERGLSAARQAGVEVILLDQQYYPGIINPARYELFVEAVRSIGVQHSVPVFSRYTLMKTWGQHSANELRAMLAADGFHMSDRGYTCLTGALGSAIAALGQVSSPGQISASAARPHTASVGDGR